MIATPKNEQKKTDLQNPKAANWNLDDESLLSSFDPMCEAGDRVLSTRPIEETLEAPEVLEMAAGFDLGAVLASIPNKLFFRIGDVADILGLKTYVLRFWETEFPMVKPVKSKSGQRVYSKKDVETLVLVKHLLYVERFSIEGARKRIRELKREKDPTGSKSKSAAPATTEVRASLQTLKALSERDVSEFFQY